ncbi:MAG: O-antigen ligase family protein [Deferribacteres bacterium]|nr:O-antigen ligase family protein [Deferribacteres bacterium]
MLINRVTNAKFLNPFFTGLLSYYFARLVMQSYSLAAALLGGAMFVFIFLTNVEYAFYFLLATRGVVDVFYTIQTTGGLRVTHVIGGGLVALFLYYAIVVSRYNLFKLTINKIYIAFLIVSIPAIFVSKSITAGLGYWFRLFQGFAIINLTIMVILASRDEMYRKKIYIISLAVVIAILFPYIVFIKNWIMGITAFGSGGIPRIAAYGHNNNLFSYFLFSVFFFCLYLYSVSERPFQKRAWFVILCILASTMIYTYTRNIWLGMLVMLFVWNMLRGNLIANTLAAAVVIVMILYNPTVQERLKDAKVIMESEGGFFELDPKLLASRIGIWQDNIDYLMNHTSLKDWLMGNGFDIKVRIRYMYDRMRPMPEHNNYLTLLMNTGIFGLAAYMFYLFALFRHAFRLRRSAANIHTRSLAEVFIAVLISYVIMSFFTHILWNITFQYHFSVFAGFIVASNIIEERNMDGRHDTAVA